MLNVLKLRQGGLVGKITERYNIVDCNEFVI